MAQQKSVTLVISHLLDPQHSQRYEELRQNFPAILGRM